MHSDVGVEPTVDRTFMINRDDNPVQWVLLMDEMQEAHEHLGKPFVAEGTRGLSTAS